MDRGEDAETLVVTVFSQPVPGSIEFRTRSASIDGTNIKCSVEFDRMIIYGFLGWSWIELTSRNCG